jgi:hypothetical protein
MAGSTRLLSLIIVATKSASWEEVAGGAHHGGVDRRRRRRRRRRSCRNSVSRGGEALKVAWIFTYFEPNYGN